MDVVRGKGGPKQKLMGVRNVNNGQKGQPSCQVASETHVLSEWQWNRMRGKLNNVVNQLALKMSKIRPKFNARKFINMFSQMKNLQMIKNNQKIKK